MDFYVRRFSLRSPDMQIKNWILELRLLCLDGFQFQCGNHTIKIASLSYDCDTISVNSSACRSLMKL